MAQFDLFLPIILRFEGGFVDDPADPGCATNKGITMKTFSCCSRTILGLEPSLDHLRSLTDEQAGLVYQELYWRAIQGDEIAHQDLANIVCDFFVNAGGRATRLLQTVLNQLGEKVPIDGEFGPVSISALAKVDNVVVYRHYKAGRISYYQNLVAQNPRLEKFLAGWLNRVNAFPDL